MKVKDIDALREQISKDPREAFTKHQVWLFTSEHNKTVPTVEAIPKDQYEARLRADMVAMLEELKSEADELEDPKYILETSELPLDVDGTTLPLETYALQCYCRGGEDVIDIIEKKINELKENKDGSN